MNRTYLAMAVSATIVTGVTGLSGCIEGGSGGNGSGVADGGIRGTGSSVGPVARFGSVFVNGTRFDTDGLNGRVESDDGIDREDELEKGMILRVEGQWRNNGQGTAERLDYDDTLRGTVSAVTNIDEVAGTAELTVLGQTVLIDGQTVLKGTTLATIADIQGEFIRVSGWRLSDGRFRASFVGLMTNGSDDDVELEGRIESGSLDRNAGTFRINGVTVEYGGSTEFDGLSESDLGDNLAVEVEGSYSGGVLMTAREVEPESNERFRRGEDDDLEIAGPVTSAWDAQQRRFSVNGIEFFVDDGTEFDDGIRREDLVEGRLVKVEADFEDGHWVAGEIELRESNAEVDGALTAPPDQDSEVLTVGGVEVRVNASTVITDDDDNNQRLDFADLGEGWSYDIEGIDRGEDGYLEALKIERENDDSDDFELEGEITALDDSSGQNRLTVLGLSILTNSSTEFDDISYGQLNVGDRVEVEYVQGSNGQFVAEEIELEEDDDDVDGDNDDSDDD